MLRSYLILFVNRKVDCSSESNRLRFGKRGIRCGCRRQSGGIPLINACRNDCLGQFLSALIFAKRTTSQHDSSMWAASIFSERANELLERRTSERMGSSSVVEQKNCRMSGESHPFLLSKIYLMSVFA